MVGGKFALVDISCNDISMNSRIPVTSPDSLLKTLADFRFELRRFLQFSECAALKAGLQPQQHQLLLQVAGAPNPKAVTIAYAAERLGIGTVRGSGDHGRRFDLKGGVGAFREMVRALGYLGIEAPPVM